MQLEDARYDKNLTGSLYYEDVFYIYMKLGIAFRLLNAILGSRWFSVTVDILRLLWAYFISQHHH